jgi:hypothetical protein
MTGKITFINRDKDYKDLQVYKVTLANGQTWSFFQPKEKNGVEQTEFELKVGEEIEFEISNAKYNTAKLIRKQKTETKSFQKPVSQQSSIEFQSCLRSAAILYSNNPTVKSSTVLETTELFYNKLKHITNV